MKIVQQEVQEVMQVPSSYDETTKHIERIGRICYQSDDKITATSAEKFCLKLFKLGHNAMIEHSWLVILFTGVDINNQFLLEQMFDSKFINVTRYGSGDVYVYGNWRAFIENYGEAGNVEFFKGMPEVIVESLDNSFPGLFVGEVLQPDDQPKYFRAYSAILKTDRAVTHELVRHRPVSFAQESQRYCAYKEKLEYILPYMYDDDKLNDPYVKIAHSAWRDYLKVVTNLYRKLMGLGEKPQEARSVLPNCTATQIAITADIDEWKYIFGIRTSITAYPQVRRLVNKIKDIFIKEDYIRW